MFSLPPFAKPISVVGSGACTGSGSTPITVHQDEHELPSLGPPLPGRYGVILKGGLSSVVVDLVQSPSKSRAFEKEHGQQQQLPVAPSSIEPGAPRRSYLAAVQASNQPFSHRKTLLPDDTDDFVPPVSPPPSLLQTDLGCYPPKGPDDEIWFMEPGELRKKKAPPRDMKMEAGIIDEFIQYKEAQRLRLQNDFYDSEGWQGMLKELREWEYLWAFGDLEQRKSAIKHGLPDVRLRIKAARDSIMMTGAPPKPLEPDGKKRWVSDTEGESWSLSNRTLTYIERPILELGPEVLPPDPVLNFTPPGLNHGVDRSSSVTSLPKMFVISLDSKEEVMSLKDRFKFYKTHGFHAARLYLKHAKSRSDQPRAEVDVPEWFDIFEVQNKVFFSNSETAQGRFMDLNFHLGSLAVKIAGNLLLGYGRSFTNRILTGPQRPAGNMEAGWYLVFLTTFALVIIDVSPVTPTRKGRMWRCRSGDGAPLSERRCRLCHGSKPRSTSFTLDESHATQSKFDLLMDCIQTAQRAVARRDRQVVENRMRAEARAAGHKLAQTPAALLEGSSSHMHHHHHHHHHHHYGGAVERIRAELLTECAERDRANRRTPGSTAEEEISAATKRFNSRDSRRSAHF
ncbi:hypothetical protein PG996_009594 [Apiospora saccharicola]|uniref:Uncharacterized protein n=1 Tax=Apiospora saccharicola TaxID=335842 RepID=A0ABR1UL94_9PEZI